MDLIYTSLLSFVTSDATVAKFTRTEDIDGLETVSTGFYKYCTVKKLLPCSPYLV